MFFRVTRAGKHQYVQIARSYRDGGKVKQQTLLSLGRLDALRAGGQLDDLLRSGLRLSERLAVVDAHAAGETEAAEVQCVGADLVFSRLWRDLGIGEAIQRRLEGRRYDFDVERAVYLSVLHRLFAGGSDRAAERWREDFRIPGCERLELHHLYRAMAFLGEPLPETERVLGSPRCQKDAIEEDLFDRRRDLFTEIDLVFFDTTSMYFEGGGGEELGRRGHSKDRRPDRAQMIVGMVLDAEGWPLCCEMWPGNTTDVKTLLPVVDRLSKRFRVREMCVVADRGMISAKTIRELEAKGLRYILGARMRRQKEVSEKVLAGRGRWTEVHGPRKTGGDPSPLKIRETTVDGRRYVVCRNEEQRRKDARDREAILEQLREKLKRGGKSLVGNKGFRRYLKSAEGRSFEVDEESIEAERRLDGVWVLRTNAEYDAESVALAYKRLWTVESMIRATKSILETRPIYHRRDETIRGHVFCSFLALQMKVELERRLAEAEESWEWAEILRGLAGLHEIEVSFQAKQFVLRSQLKGDAYKAIRAAGAAVPPTIREI